MDELELRLRAWTCNTSLMNEDAREFLYKALREIVDRIEASGASPELTHAVILASDLASAVGNRWNRPDPHAAARVLQELKSNAN